MTLPLYLSSLFTAHHLHFIIDACLYPCFLEVISLQLSLSFSFRTPKLSTSQFPIHLSFYFCSKFPSLYNYSLSSVSLLKFHKPYEFRDLFFSMGFSGFCVESWFEELGALKIRYKNHGVSFNWAGNASRRGESESFWEFKRGSMEDRSWGFALSFFF